MKLTEDNFDEIYTPIQNHLDEDATFDGTMYETYGAELDFVFSVSQAENTNKTVWTILEVDGNMYCSAGFHRVNRFGYIITEKPWETGEEEFMYENNTEDDDALSYFISKSDYTDKEYYDIVNGQLGLPDYDSVFNNLGIVNDGFSNLFTNNSSVKVLHENIRISDLVTLQKFLLDDAQTTNSMDEVIKDVLFKYPNKPFQLGGDGDGLGFILDIWKSDDDINNGEEPIDSFQFWFEVYED